MTDDVLIGTSAADDFVLSGGNDVIEDFDPKEDTIELPVALLPDLTEDLPVIQPIGDDVLIDFGDNETIIEDTEVEDISIELPGGDYILKEITDNGSSNVMFTYTGTGSDEELTPEFFKSDLPRYVAEILGEPIKILDKWKVREVEAVGGNDTLEGTDMSDTLYGGEGSDLFIISEGSSSFSNADIIKDYQLNIDRISVPSDLEIIDIVGGFNEGATLVTLKGSTPQFTTFEGITEKELTFELFPDIGNELPSLGILEAKVSPGGFSYLEYNGTSEAETITPESLSGDIQDLGFPADARIEILVYLAVLEF